MLSVTDTVESVTETLNLSKQVEEHPWAAVGISLAAGFLVSLLRFIARLEARPDEASADFHLHLVHRTLTGAQLCKRRRAYL